MKREQSRSEKIFFGWVKGLFVFWWATLAIYFSAVNTWNSFLVKIGLDEPNQF